MSESTLADLEAVSLEQDAMDGKYLTFWTDNQLFGIPIADVVQIVGIQQITSVPEFPLYAKGIINLRGSIIPIVDVRLRFGKEEIPYNERTCIIVSNIGGVLIGFIVDGVEEVSDIADDMISQPPKVSGNGENAYLTGIGRSEDRIILLLDPQKILSGTQLDSISRSMRIE